MGFLGRWFRRWGGEYFEQAHHRQKAARGDVPALQALARDALAIDDLTEAAALIGQALALAPDDPSLLVTQAAIERRQNDFLAARATLTRALHLAPDHPRALTNLAELDLIDGAAQLALQRLDIALRQEPDLLAAQVNRVAALSETGEHEAARALGERLLKRHPDHPELLLNTANALLQQARGREAVKLLRRALQHKPAFPAAEFLLAVLVGDTFALIPALDYLEERLTREGETLGLLVSLANGHQAAGHLGRARSLAHRILQREPGHVGAMLCLANVASTSGHADQADRVYEALFHQAGDLSGMASNWLFEGNYLPHLAPADLFNRHRDWAQAYEKTVQEATRGMHHGPLRVGYVSGDFCRHPVGSLVLAILKRHDRRAVAPVAFSTTLREDDLTREIKEAFVAWHEVFDTTDDDLVELIRREKIDILVDLAGHTAFHRLRVFARRAAPVQVSWIGYFHSTGLRNIDYLITDPFTSPREIGQHFSETPIHLGSTRFCFSPPPYAPAVVPAPARRGNPFTFGCFNRLAKLNDEVIAAWAEILQRAPSSRLWLKAGALADAGVRTDVSERFAAQGIPWERLILRPGSGHAVMLDELAMIDLCLDPFPFTGGATSLESLWMGVPTLTVPGATMVSRQTHAMNVNLGLDAGFSASGVRDYIERAVAFARQPAVLWPLRERLRDCMAKSPLCDETDFTRRLENFYRQAADAARENRKLPACSVIS